MHLYFIRIKRCVHKPTNVCKCIHTLQESRDVYINQPMSVNASILYKNQEICTETTNVCKCIHTLQESRDMYRNQPMSVNASILYKESRDMYRNRPMSVNASILHKNQEISTETNQFKFKL